MSTERLGLRVPGLGGGLGARTAAEGDSQLGWGYMSTGPEAFPPSPCLRSLAGGEGRRGSPGPGAGLSVGPTRVSSGLLTGPPAPRLSNAPYCPVGHSWARAAREPPAGPAC